MAGQMWFGTRGYMRWIKCPAVGIDASKVGWETSSQLLNGKKFVRRSVSSHKEYQLAWNLAPRTDLQPIMDYADGMFGTGKIYWVDPFIMDRNMFPMDWSVPMQGGYDGTILNGGEDRPELVATTSNGNGYPALSASYTVVSGQWVPEVWLPIPEGYTLHLGFHGIAGTGGTVTYAVTTGAAVGSATALTPLSVSSPTRTNASVASTTGDGVIVKLGGSGTVTITALTAVLVPTSGSVAPVGAFISGGGHAGCSFASQPALQQYSAALDKVGLTVTLIEDI